MVDVRTNIIPNMEHEENHVIHGALTTKLDRLIHERYPYCGVVVEARYLNTAIFQSEKEKLRRHTEARSSWIKN